MTEDTIFATALEKADPTERTVFLKAACGADAELLRRLESLLAAHDRAGSFLKKSPVEPPADKTSTFSGDGDELDDARGFLTPSTKPGSLGRIDHYEILELLGRGGFGIVFRAFDDVLQRVVAVKVLAPSMAATSPARKRFLREARSSAAVRHENVVQVHAVDEQPLPYLVMEFVPGETLQRRIDRTGPLDIREILRTGRQIAEGLAAAHATGLIHRDIKPSNVLIGPDGRVKITDFGLARAADDASLTHSGTVAGTPLYMAPEQAKGETLDHRADLFSLGSVLYVMATGRPPFRASNTFAVLKRVAEEQPRPMREIIPETPEWYCRIVEKLHAKSPDERFQTAREVADILADCERQMEAHAGVKDLTRIPAPVAKRTTTRRARWFVAAVWAFTLLFMATVRYGDPTYRYLTDSASIEFVPADGIESVTVHQDGAPVNPKVPRYGMPSRESIPVPQGQVTVVPTLAPGHVVDHWDILTEGLRPGRAFWKGFRTARVQRSGDGPLTFTVERGVRATLTPVTKVAPTADRSASDGNSNPFPSPGWTAVSRGEEAPGWGRFDNPAADCRLERNGGTVRLTVPAGNHDLRPGKEFNTLAPRVSEEVTGDFTLRVKVEPVRADGAAKSPTAAFPLAGAGLLVWQDEKNFVRALRTDTGKVHVHWFQNGAEGSVPASPDAAYLSIGRVGKRLTLRSSPDGRAWGDLCKIEPRLGDRVRVGVAAVNTRDRDLTFELSGHQLTRPATQSEGFTLLFNGQDLTGWTPHPDAKGDWSVADGALVGRAGGQPSYLFSASDAYANFHLRVEAQMNDRAESGVFCRATFGVKYEPVTTEPRVVGGYEAQLCVRPLYPVHTGSIITPDGPDFPRVAVADHRADEWVVLEVIAEGNRLRTLVNGKPAKEYVDPNARFVRGHLVLQAANPGGVVRFRKIEIKELPPTAAPDPAVAPLEDLVAATEKSRDRARQQFEAGVINKGKMIAAEIDLLEARVKLAEAKRDRAGAVALLEDLVTQTQAERDFVAARAEAGQVSVGDVTAADARLAEAKVRLARAKAATP